MSELTPQLLAELAEVAAHEGLLRLAAVRLDHPGFSRAAAYLDRFVEQGRHGEMDFIARSVTARKDPAQMLPGARTLLVALVPYAGQAGPVARYAQGIDYHTVLHRRFEAVVQRLQARLPDVQVQVCVDTRPIMERAAAVLAGLGFLGKNGCVIVPGLGSYVLLGELLCTATWAGPDAVPDVDRVLWQACGTCRLCLDACPTDAFVAPGELDPRRCISYLTIEHRGAIDEPLAAGIGERIAGCDVCQEVCPYNATSTRRDRAPPQAWLQPRPTAHVIDLVELANLRSGRYRAFVRESALRRIPRRHLRRNALLALGNRSGELSSQERSALDQATTDPDPTVRQAARRALHRRD